MSRALGEIPLTCKLRTGVKEGHNTAHKLMPRVRDWGVSMMTVGAYIVYPTISQVLKLAAASWPYTATALC
jgi:tRNA-dihydrouridine synthase